MVGVGLGIFYWFLESVLDTFLFNNGNIVEQIFAPDPNEFWMRLLVICLFIIFGLYAQITINRRKLAEEEFENSISLLRATLESTADGILVVNNEGKMISFNRKFVEMWQIPKSIIASRDDNKALAFVLDQLKEPDIFLSKVRELYSKPDAESYDVLEFKDGRIFERYSQPQRIGARSVGRVWSFRDVTRLKEADRLKSEFVSHISHEIRTPLTSIKGSIDNMRDGVAGELNERQKDYLERMHKNANRLVHLINNLLDISRLEKLKSDSKDPGDDSDTPKSNTHDNCVT